MLAMALPQTRAILAILIVCIHFTASHALYSKNSGVLLLNDKTFNEHVIDSPGVAIVEFYAPW